MPGRGIKERESKNKKAKKTIVKVPVSILASKMSAWIDGENERNKRGNKGKKYLTKFNARTTQEKKRNEECENLGEGSKQVIRAQN